MKYNFKKSNVYIKTKGKCNKTKTYVNIMQKLEKKFEQSFL